VDEREREREAYMPCPRCCGNFQGMFREPIDASKCAGLHEKEYEDHWYIICCNCWYWQEGYWQEEDRKKFVE